VEGGILFGLTAALLGRISVENGSVVEGNFDTYPLLRIDETPEIEIRFIPSGEQPGGLGELGVPTVAPAVANALFAARGARARTLPLRLNG
jgi:isoquinoline 1-oxidoreductase beta subunit